MTEHDRPPTPPEPEPEPSEPADWNTDSQVQRWRAGGDGGFLALGEYFQPLLLSRVRRSSSWAELARYHQAEDVVRRVLAWASKHGGEPFAASGKGSFLAMLRRLCDRTLDELVGGLPARRRRRGDGGGDPGRESSSGARPDDAADSPGVAEDEELEGLARWLLTDREYLAWRHVDREGYAAEEVGDLVLDCSASAVVQLLSGARARLDTLR